MPRKTLSLIAALGVASTLSACATFSQAPEPRAKPAQAEAKPVQSDCEYAGCFVAGAQGQAHYTPQQVPLSQCVKGNREYLAAGKAAKLVVFPTYIGVCPAGKQPAPPPPPTSQESI